MKDLICLNVKEALINVIFFAVNLLGCTVDWQRLFGHLVDLVACFVAGLLIKKFGVWLVPLNLEDCSFIGEEGRVLCFFVWMKGEYNILVGWLGALLDGCWLVADVGLVRHFLACVAVYSYI
jgi:hypothetical protein